MNATPATNSATPGILVSDFDGTITQFDFYDLVCREYPEIAGRFWHQYEAGTYSPARGLEMRLPAPSPVQPFDSWRAIARALTTPNREQP